MVHSWHSEKCSNDMHSFNHFSHACIERLSKLLILLALVKHPGKKVANAFSGNWKQGKREMQRRKMSHHGASICINILDLFFNHLLELQRTLHDPKWLGIWNNQKGSIRVPRKKKKDLMEVLW